MIEVINQKEILLRVYKYPYKSVFNRLKEHCLSYRYNHYKEIFYLFVSLKNIKNMSLLEQKKDFSKRGAFDELYTPNEAVEMILPYIPKDVKIIWECTAIKESKIVKVLRNAEYDVVTSHIEDGQDFFKYQPENYDMIITNPPYSLKDKFLKRAYDLKKPFMFLLPLTTLEGIERGKMFDKNGIQMLIPNKRFNFKPEKKSGAWFQTSWFCFGCELSSDLNFVSLK